MDAKIQQIMDALNLTELQARRMLRDHAEILRRHPVRSSNWLK